MRFLGSPISAYTSQALKGLVKTGHRVYFHITILVNRSVQLVARNHECLKALNNVLCVFGRASRCMLRTKSRITHRG